MGTVTYIMSMSLDGFVTADGRSMDDPLGIGGVRLHEWGMPPIDPRSDEARQVMLDNIGAMITGRRTYDESLRYWGANGPADEQRTRVFVVTSRDDTPPEGSVYTFVTDGIDSAIKQAQDVAGDKDVAVSGVRIGRQLLQAGYIDELWITVVPVLFGAGTHLYEQAGEHIELELLDTVSTEKAIHLHYRVHNENRR